MVHKDDDDNIAFKAAALRAFLEAVKQHGLASQLIIAVDPSKFVLPIENLRSVISEVEWQNLLKEEYQRIVAVTAPPPTDFSLDDRVAFEREVEAFERVGVAVDRHPQ